MAEEDYTVKKITDVAETTTADTLFIKSGGDIKQISMANLLTQIYPDIEMAALKKQMPIGYIFVWNQASSSGIDLSTAEKVAEYYGFGTWEQIKDRFLLGAGDNYEAGGTGGEAAHTLTVAEMPSHSHNIHSNSTNGTKGYTLYDHNSNEAPSSLPWQWAGSNIQNTGGSQSHNNMPPYFTVYIWRRIA
jgi:hypothetical protein